ncbi:hypothetical protein V8359_16390 [Roseovarius sp. E0-M6]
MNLYDTLKILFSKGMGTRLEVLRFNRPSNKQLDTYEKYALEFFECVHASFPEVRDYLDAAPSNVDGSALRSASGGHLLFRPIGLEIIAENYCHLKKSRVLSQSEITSLLSSLPSQLSEAPYRGLVWNPRKESINTKGKGVAKRVVGYMLGSDTDEATLLADYRKALEGVEKPEEMKLPEKVA